MAALSSKLRSVVASDGHRRISYWCPGCKHAHVLPVEGTGHPTWSWDGNVDQPTVNPSILSRADFPPEDGGPEICHHFLHGGQLQFLPDSTHALAGQTVPLPDWPANYSDGDKDGAAAPTG